MPSPCRTDCPASDCAGCAFPPLTVRCEPSRPCSASSHCARFALSGHEILVDGCIVWRADEGRCALFVDERGLALRAVAA